MLTLLSPSPLPPSLLPSIPLPLRVIVEAESVSDWSGKVTEIKRSFLQLKDNLHSIRGESKPLQYPYNYYYALHCNICAAGTKISSAAEGNLLEAINLAITGNSTSFNTYP